MLPTSSIGIPKKCVLQLVLLYIHVLFFQSPCAEESRFYNTHLMLANDGSVAGKYNKLHLFDVDIKGGARLKESDGCVAGKELPPVVKTPVGNVGLAIVSFNSLSIYIYIYIYNIIRDN